MRKGIASAALVLAGAFGIAGCALGAAPVKLHWYRGNTHTHTSNSDGNASPEAVASWYQEHGYQFLFITDHEVLTDVVPLNARFGASQQFLVLPGQEVTQWSVDQTHDAAHVNSLFATKVIWPIGVRRCMGKGCGAHADATLPLSEIFKTNLTAIQASGAIAQINHPNYHWSVKPDDLNDIPDHTLIEVWNGIGSINNLGGTDDNGDTRPSAEGYWDHLLSRGKLVYAVASDDAHELGPEARESAPGQAWIMVRASELTPAAIQAALRAGDFYATTGVTIVNHDVVRFANSDGETLTIALDAGPNGPRYTTRFIGNGGRILAERHGSQPTYTITGTEGYIRASIIDSNGKRAWTQPIFTDARRGR